jgi:shikimate dehydrogenase
MKKLFVFGTNIPYSISPAICNAALRLMKLDWHYALWDLTAEALPEAVEYLRRDDCIGANVTIPHKEAVFGLVDEWSDSARDIRAVNTIINRGGRLAGDNTDGIGFMQVLRDMQFDPRGAHVVILGAGGAARGVAFALGQAGAASITLVNRTQPRALELATELRRHMPQLLATADLADMPADPTLVVNSLPPSVPFDLGPLRLSRDVLAFDLTYHPTETPFMREVARTAARVVNGVAMLVYQGAASLRLWTGREPDVSAMFKAAHQTLKDE